MKFAHYKWVLVIGSVCLSLLAAIGSVELYWTVTHWQKHGGSRSHLIEVRERLLNNPRSNLSRRTSAARWEHELDLHPYFGYVHARGLPNANNFGLDSRYNFLLCETSLCLEPEPSGAPIVAVGLFGGSFAHLTGLYAGDYLEQLLAEQFPGRQVRVINFGMGGHAMPQAFFLFSYFADLIDYAIFLDGVNEVWNPVDNNQAGVPPLYAKAAHYQYKLSAHELTPERFKHTSTIVGWKQRIRSFTRFSLWPIVRHSAATHLAWRALVRKGVATVSSEMEQLERSYLTASTRFFQNPDPQILRYGISEWGRFHRLAHQIAKDAGIRDFHFLQPNLRVGRKPLTKSEQAIAANPDGATPGITQGYDLMRSTQRELKRLGATTKDLKDIFSQVTSDIWVDGTHTNEAGARITMEHIAREISLQRTSKAELRASRPRTQQRSTKRSHEATRTAQRVPEAGS